MRGPARYQESRSKRSYRRDEELKPAGAVYWPAHAARLLRRRVHSRCDQAHAAIVLRACSAQLQRGTLVVCITCATHARSNYTHGADRTESGTLLSQKRAACAAYTAPAGKSSFSTVRTLTSTLPGSAAGPNASPLNQSMICALRFAYSSAIPSLKRSSITSSCSERFECHSQRHPKGHGAAGQIAHGYCRIHTGVHRCVTP